ncbi:response regulator transcription factor [Nocardioides okcheonensis]|uniref:response regulator transcription factor n=1 Tax=Nocardioides okcheonensis TaxID=2894081 RepID=UPI001E60223E|nr:response regulator transcription factor [Nocardioides okcheonensis]UFN45115.1 response regulator transcription factor [Nocardioides okcheonensis]
MALALVVEDDPLAQRMLSELLPALGHGVLVSGSGRECLEMAAAHRPDVILLDLGLPDVPGTAVISSLRQWTDTPIVVVSGSRQIRRKTEALDAGADDFIDKPFDVSELRARIGVVERRLDASQQGVARRRFADVEVDYRARRVHRGTREVRLTETEWLILDVLSREPGRVVTRRWLSARVWGSHAGSETHPSLRAHVKALRAKLGDDARDPSFIRTETGVGYRWVSAPAPLPATSVDDLATRLHLLRDDLRRWLQTSTDPGGDCEPAERVISLLDDVANEIDAMEGRDLSEEA